MERLQSIQILRFIAATIVVVKHATSVHLGGAGVDVFFVISGFIIARVSIGKTAGQFMSDRVRRVYPIYLICSVPYAIMLISVRGLEADKLVASLTLWPVFGVHVGPYLKQAWSLSFEMLFYSGTALVLWKPSLLRPMFLIYAAALPLSLTGLPLFRFIGSPLIIEFGMGVWIATAPKISARAGGVLIGLALMALLATIPLSAAIYAPESASGWLLARVMVWGMPAAMIVYGGLQLEPFVQGRIASYLARLGDASYSIYLIHLVVVAFVSALAPSPVAALAAVLAGVAVHRYIEAPLTALLKRKRKPAPEAVTSEWRDIRGRDQRLSGSGRDADRHGIVVAHRDDR